MATKSKTAAPAEETIQAQEPEEKAVKAEEKKPADPWAEEIEMIVPRKPKGEEQHYYICVNDRRYLVPADGRTQKLPKPVALALKDSLEAEWEADDYADSIPNRDGSSPQEHAI